MVFEGTDVAIANASAKETIASIKRRVLAANPEWPVHRQLVTFAGMPDMEPLADDLTLDEAGVAQDGSAVLDVVLEWKPEHKLAEFRKSVCCSVL